MHPQLDELMQVCICAGVTHVVLAGGIPPGPAVRAVKDSGAKLICFAPALVLAKRFVQIRRRRTGDRRLGSRRPYRPGVAHRAGAGNPAASARRAGVRGRRPGARRGGSFLYGDGSGRSTARHPASRRRCESIAHENFKRAFVRANARDALPSVQLDERLPGDRGARFGQCRHQGTSLPIAGGGAGTPGRGPS